jgi:hypothetical protein
MFVGLVGVTYFSGRSVTRIVCAPDTSLSDVKHYNHKTPTVLMSINLDTNSENVDVVLSQF